MKAIQPTPSQAAVVLKKYMLELGVDLKLGQTQEAIARIYGYADWNTLAADMPTRAARKDKAPETMSTEASCHKCGTFLRGAYCRDLTCPYSDWPQQVPVEHLYSMSADEIEKKYKVSVRAVPEDDVPVVTLKDIVGQSLQLTVRDADLDGLHAEIERAALATGLLSGYRRQQGRDEKCMEDGSSYLQVSFDRRLNESFVTELVFTLRNHRLACYVRTWELRDKLDRSQDYRIFRERDGDFDTDAELPREDAPFKSLVVAALAEAEAHKARLRESLSLD